MWQQAPKENTDLLKKAHISGFMLVSTLHAQFL